MIVGVVILSIGDDMLILKQKPKVSNLFFWLNFVLKLSKKNNSIPFYPNIYWF